MRKIFLTVFILICFSVGLFSQQGFKKVYGEYPGKGEYLDILIDNDTLIFYGLTSDSLGQQGIRFYKADTLGNILYTQIIVDTARILTSAWFTNKIIKTSDNNYAMIGTTVGGRLYFLKINHDFDLLSYVRYESDFRTLNSSILEVEGGFFVLARKTQANSSLAMNVELIRTGMDGNELWRKEFGVQEYSEPAAGIKKIDDNTFLIYGGYVPYPEWDDPSWPQSTWGADYFLAIDSSGNKLWSWHGDSTELAAMVRGDVVLMPDSSLIYISGTWEPFAGAYTSQPLIVRRDKNMNLMWQRKIGYLGGDQHLTDLVVTPDSNFVASGFARLVDYPAYPKGIHFKFSAEGDSIWLREDSITQNDQLKIWATAVLPSGSIFSIGDYRAPFGVAGGVIMKITPDGCVDTLNCFPLSVSENIPSDGVVAFPNPASNEIHFNFSLDIGLVNLEIIDWLGRISISKQIYPQQEVDVTHLSKGIYAYKLVDTKGKLIGLGKVVKE